MEKLELPNDIKEKLCKLVVEETDSWNADQHIKLGYNAGYNDAMKKVLQIISEIEKPRPFAINWGISSKELKERLGL